MKKCLFLLIGLSVLLSGCLHKKPKTDVTKAPTKTEAYQENKAQQPASGDQVDAFMLDGDKGDYDLFEAAEKADAKKSTEPASQASAPVATKGGDDWAWKEAEQETQQAHVIHFEFDSAKIQKDQMPLVQQNAELAKTMCKKGATVVVEGHACKITRSPGHNWIISERRAKNVARKFKKLGVPGTCIKTVGRGTEQLLTEADGKQEQAINRRVEVRFLYPKGQ